MIRKATEADIPAVVSLGRMFADEAGQTARVGYEPDGVARALASLIASDGGDILVFERDDNVVGMIGLLTYPHYFAPSAMTAQEMFMYVEPAARGGGTGLIKAAEGWAREKGARNITMISLEGSKPERAERLYRCLGYAPLERHYVKEL